MTMASGRMAASVLSVSTSDSPLETLDVDAVIETASAPSRFAAISKLVRVRVDASKNRLTTSRPRSISNFLKPGSSCGWKSRARSRMASMSLRLSDSMPSKPGRIVTSRSGPLACRDSLYQQHLLGLVDLFELYFDNLVFGCLDHTPDISRRNG